MKVFSVAEVLDLGIEKEVRRRDFYALVAREFTDPKMKELFSRLRDWEETHIKKFSEIRDAIKPTQLDPVDSYPGEFHEYMSSLINDTLYSEVTPEAFKANVTSAQVAIRYGISFEKDAILFFNEFLPLAGSGNKEAIQKVIEEEKKHIVYLAKLRLELEQ